jgi:hypothetical protein
MNTSKQSTEKSLSSLRKLLSQKTIDSKFNFKFSITIDTRTKKIKLNYSEPTKGKMIGAELHITETKQKQKYIADHTVHEYKSFVNNIDSYLIEVLNEINLAKTRIKNQLGDGLEYWIGKYLDLYRSPGRTLSQATVDSDRSVLNALLHYLFTTEPQIKLISDYNNIVHNNYF